MATMKPILLFLFLSAACGVKGQDTTKSIIYFDTTYLVATPSLWVRVPAQKLVMDTARVLLVCSDTSFYIRVNRFFGHPVLSFTGYEVTEKRILNYYSVLVDGRFVDKPIYSTSHVAYLDEMKKPLSKSIVVIQTIKAE